MTAGPLHGRGALVTGGGRGIGAAVARALAGAGAGVVVAARTGAELEAVADLIRGRGGRAFAVAADVTREDSVEALAAAARMHLGTVDIVVNSAGDGASAPFHRISLADWNAMLAVHATGTFLVTRALLPAMLERGWGRAVNIASIAGVEGARYVSHYSAAKHAVVGFTRSVALEIEGRGVTINAVCPGYVATAMTERTVAGVMTRSHLDRDRALAAVLATTGQDRLIAPEEVAEAVLGLCRDEAADVNGRILALEARAEVP